MGLLWGYQCGFNCRHFFAEGLIMSKVRVLRFAFCVFFLFCFFCGLAFAAPRKGWKRKEVDIRAGNGHRIRGIYYPTSARFFSDHFRWQDDFWFIHEGRTMLLVMVISPEI
jgi:hypothetical protein